MCRSLYAARQREDDRQNCYSAFEQALEETHVRQCTQNPVPGSRIQLRNLFRGAGTLITSLIAIPAASRALVWAMRSVFVAAVDMVNSGSFIPFPRAGEAFDAKGAAHRLDRLALDIEWPPAMFFS